MYTNGNWKVGERSFEGSYLMQFGSFSFSMDMEWARIYLVNQSEEFSNFNSSLNKMDSSNYKIG